jgi:metallo-beta-lactamase superfamily protein
MRKAKPERPLPGYLIRRPASLAAVAHIARPGALRPRRSWPPHDRRRRAADGRTGAPAGRCAAGHTPRRVGYLFPDRGLLFTGDALVTYDALSGRHGPAVVSRAFTQDSQAVIASLEKLDAIDAALLLPGHGEPFPGSLGDAADQARRAALH